MTENESTEQEPTGHQANMATKFTQSTRMVSLMVVDQGHKVTPKARHVSPFRTLW